MSRSGEDLSINLDDVVRSPGPVRPGGVTVAAVTLIVLGALLCSGALGLIVLGVLTAEEPGAGGMFVLIGLIALGMGTPYLIAGVKILRLSNTWRIVAIALGAFSAWWSVELIGSGDLDLALFGIGLLLVHLLVLVPLFQHGKVFVTDGSSSS